MKPKNKIAYLAITLLVLSCPAFADSLQKKYEGEMSEAATKEQIDTILNKAIEEGLTFLKNQDFIEYLSAFYHAYVKFPAALTQFKSGGLKEPNIDARRKRLLEEIKLPLSQAYLSLARFGMQSTRSEFGYGLNLTETFHKDHDLAIVFKNANALHNFYFGYLAKADLDSDINNPAAAYKKLLISMAQQIEIYSLPDYKDIFYFQAPDASADYIDEEIFSLYRTLDDQKATIPKIVGLIEEVSSSDDTSLAGMHRRLKFIFGAIAFGREITEKDLGTPLPPSYNKLKSGTESWALKQGIIRTMLFGEYLASEYAHYLTRAKDKELERLRAFQEQLKSEPMFSTRLSAGAALC